jgi:hypothetical protein
VGSSSCPLPGYLGGHAAWWSDAGSPKDRLCACVQGVFENKDFLAQRGCAVGTFCSELHKAGGSVATSATAIFAQHLSWIESPASASRKV